MSLFITSQKAQCATKNLKTAAVDEQGLAHSIGKGSSSSSRALEGSVGIGVSIGSKKLKTTAFDEQGLAHSIGKGSRSSSRALEGSIGIGIGIDIVKS